MFCQSVTLSLGSRFSNGSSAKLTVRPTLFAFANEVIQQSVAEKSAIMILLLRADRKPQIFSTASVKAAV